MQRAEDHANQMVDSWSEHAYRFLVSYINSHFYGYEFMVEDVRQAALLIVPSPPSQRAWGSVILRAAKSGLIACAGYRRVKNIKAHCTPATVWKITNKAS